MIPSRRLFVLFAFAPLALLAQKPYFQQEVNYKIDVVLDDQKHSLSGNVEFEYVNHSPDTLREIWMHLWGNAFKNRRTAFNKQKLRDGNAQFYFSEEKDLGYYKNLDFSTEGRKIAWKYDPENPDIALLKLPEALLPGGRIRIATPFLLKIPASFSRLGHVETSYQITQWYPKPAVYDRKGWHPMPYLDLGEFYSEFGSFDVSISLPDNYVVGATGVLNTPSETEFLKKKETETREKLAKGVDAKTDSFPASSKNMKTLRYTAEQVHDFAWFADKRFMVLKDTARLVSGRNVDCWAMFTNSDAELWKKGAFYVKRAVEFYSEQLGEYPYPQATAVHSALSAGGGMEYPMITVINDSGDAQSLDDVIAHEVGHNWFYGLLASNERDHPFMDEGFNTYYEHRYLKKHYGDLGYDDYVPKFLFDAEKNGAILENAYLILARERVATPPDTHSDRFKSFVYGVQTYMKTGLCLAWLERWLGTERFDAAMKVYFEQWRYRHPYPEDIRAAWRMAGVEADWFFEAMKSEKQADYALTGARKAGESWILEVQNKGDLNAPFSVTALRQGQALKTQWYEAGAGQKWEIKMEAPGVESFEIDYERVTLDLNRKNNTLRVDGLFKNLEPVQLKMLAAFQSPRRSVLGILPWAGWNNYDKAMLGAVLYNPPLPGQRLQYYLAPGFGFGSGNFTGLADVRYKFFPGGPFPKITLGLSAKTFNYDYNARDDYFSKFYRIVPQIKIELRSPSLSVRHHLGFRTLFIGREAGVFDSTGFGGTAFTRNTIHEARYELAQKGLPNPFGLSAVLEWQSYTDAFERPAKYLRGSFEWRQQFFYRDKKSVGARVFAGYFLQNTQRKRGVERTAFSLNPQGFNDYRFDHVFLGRSEDKGPLSRQASRREGGFKAAFGAPFAGVLGNSNNYILALNLEADLPARLPLGIPLKPWFDLGYFDDATLLGAGRPRNEQLMWSGGLMLSFGKGAFELYFPLVNSKNLKERYCELGGGANESAIFCGGNYLKWISWSLNIPFREPGELLEKLLR
jgi:Peptidase family M1 domain